MYLHTQQFINEIAVDEPDPAAANALQEGLGGQFGEMRTMMQYLFQSINFRGDAASKPYKDLLQGVGTEEISHVELIGTTIARLLDGSPGYTGSENRCGGQAGRQRRDAAEDRVGYRQHSSLSGRSAGGSAGRRGRESMERVICLQQWKPRAGLVVQPDVGVDGATAEVPHL